MIAALGSLIRFASGLGAGEARIAKAGAKGGGGRKPPDLPAFGGSPRRPRGGPGRDGGSRDAEKERPLDRMWRYDTAWSLAERMTALVGDNTPTFIHAITVSVVGGPAADLRRMWYLACAAAFGRFRNRVNGVSAVNMEGVWDVSGKGCKISIAYTYSGVAGNTIFNTISSGFSCFGGVPGLMLKSGLTAVIGGELPKPDAGAPGADSGTFGGLDLIQQGPDQITVGDTWPMFLRRNNLEILAAMARLPALLLTDTGTAKEFEAVVDHCDDNALYARFSPRMKVDVFGELPKHTAGRTGSRTSFPWGQVSPITGKLVENYATREGVAVGVGGAISRTIRTAPKLPDSGRLITTGEKRDARVQPPRPWVDGKSRMSMVDLITASLHSPCYAPKAVECGTVPLGASTGVRLYPAGQWKNLYEPDMVRATASTEGEPLAFPDQHIPKVTK